MRNDIREDYERLLSRIQSGTIKPHEIDEMLQRLEIMIEAWCAAADLSRRSMERLNAEAKEYALLRDVLKKEKQ